MSTQTISTTDNSIPWLEWPAVYRKVNQMWDPPNAPHHSIIGLTGSGKSYLAVNGILPMCHADRVLIIDSKGDDETLAKTGKSVRELPRDTWGQTNMGRKEQPRDHWYRLVVHDDRSKAQVQVHAALDRAYREGDWVVLVDEARDLCDARSPGLGLAPWMERIWRKGRSKRVSMIALTQSPVWVPGSMYDQASFAWIGRIRDAERQKRLLQIGGMSKEELPTIAALQRREWLLAADNGEFFARTKVA